MNERRWVAVELSLGILQEMFTVGHRFPSDAVVLEGLPEGAKYISTFYDSHYVPPLVVGVFEHESFKIVQEGDVMPRIHIVMHRAGRE